MTCKWCGKEFTRTYYSQKYCCPECHEERKKKYRQEYWLKVGKKRYQKDKATTRICLYCGEEFEPEHLNAKTCCLYCSEQRRKQRNKDFYYKVTKPKRQRKAVQR